MFVMGAQELMVILLIVLVLFGGSKLPDLAKSLGLGRKVGTKAGPKKAGAKRTAKKAAAAV